MSFTFARLAGDGPGPDPAFLVADVDGAVVPAHRERRHRRRVRVVLPLERRVHRQPRPVERI